MQNPLLWMACAAAFVFAGPATADDNDWAGLYKGLDALDGSIDHLSISQTDHDTFELRVVPSVISLCASGRGWIIAEGVLIEGDKMQRRNARVFCEGEDPVELADRILTLDRDSGIIRYGASDDERPLVFHRISTD